MLLSRGVTWSQGRARGRLASGRFGIWAVVPLGGGQGLSWGGDGVQWPVLPCQSLVAPHWMVELGRKQSQEETLGSGWHWTTAR